MKFALSLRPLAASVFLFAAACGGAGPAADADNGTTLNEAEASFDEGLPDNRTVPGEADLVSLPSVPADAPAAETAPLSQAAAIVGEIDGGAGIERIPYEGGWAWRRDGRIIRTASRDGRRISYFRPGETAPFLIQRGDETFAYAGGRPQRAFDRAGRPRAVPPQRQEEARRLANDGRRDRDRAAQAPRRPENDSAGPSRGDDRRGDGNGRPGTGRPGRDDNRAGDDRGGDRGPGRGSDDRRPDRRDRDGNRQ